MREVHCGQLDLAGPTFPLALALPLPTLLLPMLLNQAGAARNITAKRVKTHMTPSTACNRKVQAQRTCFEWQSAGNKSKSNGTCETNNQRQCTKADTSAFHRNAHMIQVYGRFFKIRIPFLGSSPWLFVILIGCF